MSNDLKATIVEKCARDWEPKHHTFTQRIERLYDVWNPKGRPSAKGLRATTEAFQEIIADAIRDDARLRALGAAWSSSRVNTTDGRIINTKTLNWVFKMSERNVHAFYPGEPADLLLAQGGIMIAELNDYLAGKGRSLKTTGASNGQTIAGAMSTGTHGAALDVGPIPNFVVGIHLITGPDRHVWLERASYPVVTDAFPDRFGAELIRDDTLFDAALVSFGSFGIIQAVMIETEEIFLLEATRRRMPFDETLKHTLDTLDFSTLPTPHPGERPYHLEVVRNPYDEEGLAYVTTMYKRPYREDYPRIDFSAGKYRPGDDAAGFIGELLDTVPRLIPTALNALIGPLYGEYELKVGKLGEIFYNTTNRGKSAACSLGIPLSMASTAMERALAVHEERGPIAATVALRFVKASKALLGFQTQAPTMCIVDLDGVLSDRTVNFFEGVWEAFEEDGIPYTMHWGKLNGILDEARVRQKYGSAVEDWIAARHTLLDEASRRVFTNGFMERCGLAG